MRRQHPDHRMDIPISLEVHHQLLGASINTGFEKEDWEIAAEAIDEWVRRHDPDALATPAHSGYQWKRLFLPDGTVLRTVFNRNNYHCVVEAGRIIFNGKDVSPSGFVNAAGGMRRNAWLCTWILFPDTRQWQLADALRTRRPRRPRTGERPTKPAPAGSPSPAAQIAGAATPSEASCDHQTISTPAPRFAERSDAPEPQRRSGIPLSPPHRVRGADRRSGNDGRTSELLRQELLPLLYRICGGEALPQSSA